MRGESMRKTMHAAAAFSAAVIAGLAFSGCPMQPSYPSTITPIYAATSTGGLWVYNGSSWTNHPLAGTSNSVVVSGSGAGALVYVGGSAGVSLFNGTAWTPTTGLNSTAVSRLFSGSSIYAATALGVSILNSDGLSWTNNSTAAPVNDVFSVGTYTLVAAGTVGASSLYEYNNGSLAGSAISSNTIMLGSTLVTAVFVDFLGDIFVGTNKGFSVQNAGTSPWVPVLSVTATVNQLTMDQNGNLYAATSNGLYILTTGTALYFPGTSVSCVCVDGASTIYAGTATGLQVSTDGGRTWTTQLSGQSVNSVTTTAPLYSF